MAHYQPPPIYTEAKSLQFWSANILRVSCLFLCIVDFILGSTLTDIRTLYFFSDSPLSTTSFFQIMPNPVSPTTLSIDTLSGIVCFLLHDFLWIFCVFDSLFYCSSLVIRSPPSTPARAPSPASSTLTRCLSRPRTSLLSPTRAFTTAARSTA